MVVKMWGRWPGVVFVLVFKAGNVLDYGKETAGERIGKWQCDVLRR